MGLNYRKSIKAGPIRVNLSKSGIGTSMGPPGARIGVNANGNSYVRGGKSGVYFRQRISQSPVSSTTSVRSMVNMYIKALETRNNLIPILEEAIRFVSVQQDSFIKVLKVDPREIPPDGPFGVKLSLTLERMEAQKNEFSRWATFSVEEVNSILPMMKKFSVFLSPHMTPKTPPGLAVIVVNAMQGQVKLIDNFLELADHYISEIGSLQKMIIEAGR
jgi:hypothetical protein